MFGIPWKKGKDAIIKVTVESHLVFVNIISVGIHVCATDFSCLTEKFLVFVSSHTLGKRLRYHPPTGYEAVLPDSRVWEWKPERINVLSKAKSGPLTSEVLEKSQDTSIIVPSFYSYESRLLGAPYTSIYKYILHMQLLSWYLPFPVSLVVVVTVVKYSGEKKQDVISFNFSVIL